MVNYSEIFERIAKAYASINTYSDTVDSRLGGEALIGIVPTEITRQYRTVFVRGKGLRIEQRLRGGGKSDLTKILLWDGRNSYVWKANHGWLPANRLSSVLNFGKLIVPHLLMATDAAGLSDYGAATIVEADSCELNGRECYRIDIIRHGGSRVRLWVDSGDVQIRMVEIPVYMSVSRSSLNHNQDEDYLVETQMISDVVLDGEVTSAAFVPD